VIVNLRDVEGFWCVEPCLECGGIADQFLAQAALGREEGCKSLYGVADLIELLQIPARPRGPD